MTYVDGFLLPCPKDKVAEYAKLSKKASKIWMDHGALEYRECAGDDLEIPGMLSFNKVAKAKENETVIFAFIVYKSKAHRDAVNKKVMADKRMADMSPDKVPFDVKKMAYGGFKTIVEGLAK
jgi:uncharacterized protein YbaA (DUF1428 family)